MGKSNSSQLSKKTVSKVEAENEQAETNCGEIEVEIDKIEAEIDNLRNEFAESRKTDCFPLLLGEAAIKRKLVDKVFEELRNNKFGPNNLDVIVESGGGEIDAAYNLACLFRRYGRERLTFVVPRWAKSAATLLVCSGDEILMTPVAELGPLDPQITVINPSENRQERFSPLHIESTLQLIRDEYESGTPNLAEGLMQRLQFPLTLGRFTKSLDLGKEYLLKLLSSRMYKGNEEKAKEIAKSLTTGYADHNWCINFEEVKDLGLNANELDNDDLNIVWKIHQLSQEKRNLEYQRKRKNLMDDIKNLPSNVSDLLPQ